MAKQIVKVQPTSTEVTVEINLPDSVLVNQSGGTPIIVEPPPPPPPPVNIAPIANAGSDITIKLPTNSIILNGSGNDPDGTIKTIVWTKVSGGAATIVNPNSLVTQITGLVQGNYQFKLSLTDDDGAMGTDTVNVTVEVATNTGNVGTASGISTFHSIGIYWSGHGQTTSEAQIKYRKVGDNVWSSGLNLWRDSRSIGGRPAGEYRGSLVKLQPGTQYEIQLTAGTAINTFTVSTWNEKFPENPTIATLSSPSTITQGGTASAYKVYTGNINGGNNNLIVNAQYVVLRGMKLTGATEDAIVFGANAKDVIVENCDISGWGGQPNVIAGNNQAAIRTKFTPSTVRIIVQRCKIHDPRYSATGWTTPTAGEHPYGVNAFNLEGSGGNHVFRYNDIYGSTDGSKRFMDSIGGADNFTFTGAPGRDSDIYANNIKYTFDDSIEAEGGGMNVRVWGSFMNYTFTGVATATVSIGPCYVFNNVSNVGMRMQSQNNTEDRGPFNKCGTQESQYRGGRTYLFHNTVLQPAGNRGLCGGIVDNGGQVTNVISKNNIWTTAYQSKGGRDIGLWQGGSVNSENDLVNSVQGSVTFKGRIQGTPKYKSAVGLELNPDGYFLADDSVGKGDAVRINNFNDQDGGDIGAYNLEKLEFGVDAYK